MDEVLEGRKYRHFKGGVYRVVRARAYGTEPGPDGGFREFVVYQNDFEDGVPWVRPRAEFMGMHESGVPRFELIEDDDAKVAREFHGFFGRLRHLLVRGEAGP
jgi:hypothetical protein